MTDKQIIDGIDVSGCDFLGVKLGKNRMCACSMIDFCNEEPNCYYKNWQRAEQKLAKIEEVITHHYCNPQIAHTGCKYDEMILQIIEGNENE